MIECIYCKEQFNNPKTYSNHVKWKHKLQIKQCQYCSKDISCNLQRHENACSLNPNNFKKCLNCKNMVKKQNKFCSSVCSASFNNKKRTVKTKISNCLECNVILTSTINEKKFCQNCLRKRHNTYNVKNKNKIKCTCVVCFKEFNYFTKKKTCSKGCFSKLLHINSTNNPNCGGETNYKRYTYKNISFDSSWEIEIAKFLDKKNIVWERSRKHLLHWYDSTNTKRRYYPDFYLPKYNLYIDTKNPYKQKLDTEKIQYLQKHYSIIVGNVENCKSNINNILDAQMTKLVNVPRLERGA
jgi:hypothetical protein